MRLLGSFFHIAMNGMAASEKIFRLLDLPEEERGNQPVPQDCSLRCQGVRFSYGEGRDVLDGVDLECPQGRLCGLGGGIRLREIHLGVAADGAQPGGTRAR